MKKFEQVKISEEEKLKAFLKKAKEDPKEEVLNNYFKLMQLKGFTKYVGKPRDMKKKKIGIGKNARA